MNIEKKEINYDKLAVAIIEAYDSDRMESGRKELVRGMRYVFEKYQKEEEQQVVDDMLIAFTGYKLDTLLNMAEQISDDAVADQEETK